MLAQNTFEQSTIVQELACVVSYFSIVVRLSMSRRQLVKSAPDAVTLANCETQVVVEDICAGHASTVSWKVSLQSNFPYDSELRYWRNLRLTV